MVTDEQVRLLRRKLSEGKKQEASAAGADMCVRTARTWKEGLLPSQTKDRRNWRTRTDPFEDTWESELVPRLEADLEGKLQVKALFEDLQRRRPGEFDDNQLRTLQRRVRDWRAVYGPAKKVIFPQDHPPGRDGAFDFTHCTELDVSIGGTTFVHLLFVFRLAYSGWTWVQLAFGETYEAVVSGLQGALRALGGVPARCRHDNLSAATHELRKSGGRSLNARFQQFLRHYDLRSSRIRPGESHENGIAEKGNDLVKTALEQALLLRGHRNFDTVETYTTFVDDVISRDINKSAVLAALAEERPYLEALPSARFPEYTEYNPTVRRWSTIRVASRLYSVPSRLIGHKVVVRQFADVLHVYYGDKLTGTMPRLRGDRSVRINYRHIIWSLVRTPGAFASYKFREELFPNLVFRQAYDALKRWRGERADIEYVRILHLAAATMECQAQAALELLLETGDAFDYVSVKELVNPVTTPVPEVSIPAPDLSAYDRFLEAH